MYRKCLEKMILASFKIAVEHTSIVSDEKAKFEIENQFFLS